MAAKRSKVITKPASKSKAEKAKSLIKSKGAVKSKPTKAVTSVKAKAPIKKEKPAVKAGDGAGKNKLMAKSKNAVAKPVTERPRSAPVEVTRQVSMQQVIVKRAPTHLKRPSQSGPTSRNVNQFAFMKAPVPEHAFEVGDNVEVFCDHEKGRERVRGWIKGIVVQVDNKMVAVQFRSNVFLTDGWMVPDRILWYPLTSEHIRPVPGKKSAAKRDIIPDY